MLKHYISLASIFYFILQQRVTYTLVKFRNKNHMIRVRKRSCSGLKLAGNCPAMSRLRMLKCLAACHQFPAYTCCRYGCTLAIDSSPLYYLVFALCLVSNRENYPSLHQLNAAHVPVCCLVPSTLCTESLVSVLLSKNSWKQCFDSHRETV